MKRIWSRSAGIITSTAGQPATGRSSGSTSSDPVLAKLRETYPNIEFVTEDGEFVQASKMPRSWMRWSLQIRWWKIRHLFGVHAPVPVERWNKETWSISYVGLRCWLCDAVC